MKTRSPRSGRTAGVGFERGPFGDETQGGERRIARISRNSTEAGIPLQRERSII
jgi:hypothetical protein